MTKRMILRLFPALVLVGSMVPQLGCDPCTDENELEDVRLNGTPLAQGTEQAPLHSGTEVMVEWTPECPRVVQAYHGGMLIFPEDSPHEASAPFPTLKLSPSDTPFEVKVWAGHTVVGGWVSIDPSAP